MRYYLPVVALIAAVTLPAPAAHAIPMTFGGILSGANETPPVNSPGAGSVPSCSIRRPKPYKSSHHFSA
jgi:hypothetical protein